MNSITNGIFLIFIIIIIYSNFNFYILDSINYRFPMFSTFGAKRKYSLRFQFENQDAPIWCVAQYNCPSMELNAK